MAKIHITVEVDDDLLFDEDGKQGVDVATLLRDALQDFMVPRRHSDRYVEKRYPSLSADAAEKKVIEVERRLAVASEMLCVHVEVVRVEPAVNDETLLERAGGAH
jgi:hypothetical protein